MFVPPPVLCPVFLDTSNQYFAVVFLNESANHNLCLHFLAYYITSENQIVQFGTNRTF